MNREEVEGRMLHAIGDLTLTNGYPPTYRELADATGLALSQTFIVIGRLKAAGLVNANPRIARGITLARPQPDLRAAAVTDGTR